jgi:amino acid transporter/nucleotide-binding universal stress UspA family protein
VSALLFDYVLTGPISAVSAGQYIAGLMSDVLGRWHAHLPLSSNSVAALFAITIISYFWRRNTQGLRESSHDALRIIQITTVMVVILLAWSMVTLLLKGGALPPAPTVANLRFSDEAVGWLKGSPLPTFTAIAMLIGFGHAFLAMSGEESLAQVYREIEHPKVLNLRRTGLVIFIYSLVFTSSVSFLAVALIPDATRARFSDNLISGIAMHLVGPLWLRLLFQMFVVLVGFLILAGGVNTAIVGSNAVLNRVSEDGVLPEWFRHPHRRFGTTNRFINLIVLLQIITILLSRGNVDTLGEAYAFGVVWSFAMKALSVLVLRYKLPEAREWKVPLNFRWGKTEIPVGLGLITLVLFAIAAINILTKKVATITGLGFATAFFIAFEITERLNRRGRQAHSQELEKFRLDTPDELADSTAHIRPGNVLIAVRNPHQLDHLKSVLDTTDTRRIDIVVVSVKFTGQPGFGEHDLTAEEVFSTDIAKLFSLVVSLAEKAGKHVELMVVPGRDPNLTLVETAQRLRSALVVMGRSGKISEVEQAKLFGDAWESLPEPRPQLSLRLYDAETKGSTYFNMGPHPPRLWPEDIDLLHRLWLELSQRGMGPKLHHRDVVRVALRHLDAELHSPEGNTVLGVLSQELNHPSNGAPEPPKIPEPPQMQSGR